MTAYVIVAETVKDEAMFDEYRKQVPATLAPFGGKFIVRACGTALIIVCCLMVVLGTTVLSDQLHGPQYLLYWSWCFLITLLAALAALLDLLLVRRAGQRSRQALLHEQFRPKD